MSYSHHGAPPSGRAILNGRGGAIRTLDLMLPKHALYQAKLHPDVYQRYFSVAIKSFNAIKGDAGERQTAQPSVLYPTRLSTTP